MSLWLIAVALGVDYASVHSDKTLTAAEYAALPIVRLLSAAETKAFFRPLLERLESRRADDLPPECSGPGAIHLIYDVAGKLTALAKEQPRDERTLRVLAALGLGDAQLAALCLRPAPGGGLSITGLLSLRRYSGLLATLGPNEVPSDTAFAAHYWSAGLRVRAADAWTSVKQLDRAAAGTRGARIDGMLQGASTVLGANVERAVITPLTGRALAGLVYDAKSKRSARLVELSASDTSAAAAVARLVEESMPRADFGRERASNEWGFIGALSGVGELGGSLFVKLFDKRMVYAEAPFALDVEQKKLPSKLGAGALVFTVDLARYRGLYERVGRPADSNELFADLRLSGFVNTARAPHPKALFAGVERMTLVVSREEGGLRLEGIVR